MFCCPDMSKSERAALEKKLIMGFTALTILGFLLEIIAVSTDSWLLFYIEGGLYQNKSNAYLQRVYSGLWRICRVTTAEKAADASEGRYMSQFPLDQLRSCHFRCVCVNMFILTPLQ